MTMEPKTTFAGGVQVAQTTEAILGGPQSTVLPSAGPILFAALFGVNVANTAATNKTGIDNALAFAAAEGGGIVILPGGTNASPLLTNGGHDVPGGVEVWGSGGTTATTVLNQGATWGFRVTEQTSGQQAGGVRRLQVVGSDGTHAAVNGGIGIEIGNGLSHVVEDVFVYGFTGSGSVGVRFHNTAGAAQYVEQANLRHVFIANCATHLQFTSDAGAGTSFGYTNLDAVSFEVYAGQVGIDIGGPGTGTAFVYNSRIVGEMHFVGDNAVGVLVSPYGQFINGASLDIRGEYTTGTAQTRIKNQGQLAASGKFFVAGGQPPDDYSKASLHEFQEENVGYTDLAPAARTTVAAGALVVPGGSSVWDVSGNANINALAPQTMWEGRVVTLRFTGAPLLTSPSSGGTFILAGNVDFRAAANNTITFVWHNSTPYEIGRKT